MTAFRFVLPFQTVINGAGAPLPDAQLYFFVSGTDTPSITYSNSGLTIPNLNPVVADGFGMFGNIFLDPAVIYKVRLEDAEDVEQWTADPVQASAVLPLPSDPSYPNDELAALGGVKVGQLYRNGSVIQMRIS